MNILICDDMPRDAETLAGLLDGSGLEVNTVVFHKASDALDFARSGKIIDVFFLDIVMPETNGIELAKQLRADGCKGQIVFLSTSNEYGPDTYKVKAFSYLIKPPTQDSVNEVLRELFDARKNGDTGGLLIKNAGSLRLILYRELSHVEVINHTIYFRLADGSVVETGTNVKFAEIVPQLLSEERFVRCHRSYIVNMDMVSETQNNYFVMRNGDVISISRSCSEAKERYLNWVIGRTWR